jgi:hypothetical protein
VFSTAFVLSIPHSNDSTLQVSTTTEDDVVGKLSHSDKQSADEKASIIDKIEYKMEGSRPTGLRLTVTTHALGVASLPGSSVGTTDGVIGAVTLHT